MIGNISDLVTESDCWSRHNSNTSAVADGTLDEDSEKEEQDTEISEKQRHQLKHRELFLSRQVETLPATHIRGKCTVTLLNETESMTSYLDREVRYYFIIY